MPRMGLLQTMAREDLDALLECVGRRYRPGTIEALALADPAWRESVERAEREVGALYAELCEADAAVTRWRQAVAELCRLWARVESVPAPDEAALEPTLEEVA